MTPEQLCGHREALVGYLLKRCGDRRLAEDLAHDVLERALRRLRQGGYADEGKPFAWLVTIARNVLTDYLKRAETQRTLLCDVGPGDRPLWQQPLLPEQLVEQAEATRAARAWVAAALGELTHYQQRLLRMRFWDELDNAGAAAALGCRADAAKSATHRAFGRLRAQLAGTGGTGGTGGPGGADAAAGAGGVW